MGRIQSSVGLVTGINIEDTVNRLMELNAIPLVRQECTLSSAFATATLTVTHGTTRWFNHSAR